MTEIAQGTDGYFNGVTPVGYLVAGSLFIASTRGYQGKMVEPHYYAQVAIPKSDPGLQAMFDIMGQAAAAGFVLGEPSQPHFSWKRQDGDDPKHAGREKYPGHWVFRFQSGVGHPPKIVDMATGNQQIIDTNRVKLGYQVRVGFAAKANGNAEKPGVYLNLNLIQLVAVDAEIITGPDANQVFGAPVQARPTTIAAPQQQYAPQNPTGPPQQPQQQYAPQNPTGPPQPVQPDYGFLNPQQPDPNINPATGLPWQR